VILPDLEVEIEDREIKALPAQLGHLVFRAQPHATCDQVFIPPTLWLLQIVWNIRSQQWV
jgi:hypothetical protein